MSERWAEFDISNEGISATLYESAEPEPIVVDEWWASWAELVTGTDDWAALSNATDWDGLPFEHRSVTIGDEEATADEPTHVVTFDHPNSLMPNGYGTATAPDGDVMDILTQAVETDPHLSADNIPLGEIDTATIYRVDARVEQ